MGEKEQPANQEAIIEITSDGMQATIFFIASENIKKWTRDQVLGFLSENGINYGIDKSVVLEITKGRQFRHPVVIAKGLPARQGKDGYYEYLFNTELKPKPKMNEDGSVDYHHIDCFEPVKEGQPIAHYHKATKGTSGFNVMGEEIIPKPGKDLPVLRGKGFLLNEEEGIYTAEFSGKVELTNAKKLVVTSIYEIKGCVDYSVGNVDFDGDVVVRQDILTGFSVKATGSVFVDGCVEAAVIEAGKDIVLKNGMQGGEKGRVTAGGMIIAKFFEAASIKVKGNLTANVIMNSHVLCGGTITVLGKFGSIIGGYVWGMEGIITTQIGNIAQTKTVVEAGILQKHLDQLEKLEDQLYKKREELGKLEEILVLIKKRSRQKAALEAEQKEIAADRKQKVLDSIQVKKEEIEYIYKERTEKRQVVRSHRYVQIEVHGMVHRGSKIRINTAERRIEKGCRNVIAESREGSIVLHSGEKEL